MYKSIYQLVREYWENYGGFVALFSSPYLHFSFILTAIILTFSEKNSFSETAIQILPNILGFSIGSFAIIISSINFIKLDSNNKMNGGAVVIITTFLHFMIVQNLTLLFALIGNSIVKTTFVESIILLFLMYSLNLVFATAFALFRFARMMMSSQAN